MSNTSVQDSRQDLIYKLDQWNVKSFLKRLFKPLRFWLFLDSGCYNGSSSFKWSRIKCWLGSHEWEWRYYMDEVLVDSLKIYIPCNRCGFGMEFRLTTSKEREWKGKLSFGQIASLLKEGESWINK